MLQVQGLTPICSSVVIYSSSGKRIQAVQGGQLRQCQCWELIFEEGVALTEVGCGSGYKDRAAVYIVADDCRTGERSVRTFPDTVGVLHRISIYSHSREPTLSEHAIRIVRNQITICNRRVHVQWRIRRSWCWRIVVLKLELGDCQISQTGKTVVGADALSANNQIVILILCLLWSPNSGE